MIDRKAELDAAEADAGQYLQNRPAQIDANLATMNAAVAKSRAGSNDDIASVLKSVGERFNISPDVVGAGLPTVQRGNEDLAAANTDALAFRKAKENQATFNTTFNFAFNRLTQAGVDAKAARQSAMQYALDTQRREAESTANAKGRQVAIEKQDILDEFNARRIALEKKHAEDKRKSAIYNGIVRSFAGLAGAGAGFMIGGPVGAAAGGTAASSAADGAVQYGPRDESVQNA